MTFSERRHIHPRPRLSGVMSLISPHDTFADIGCDHGRLGLGLLQSGIARRAVLSEISPPSLEKARRLASVTGLDMRVDFRIGDGLSVLKPYEANAIGICGMGGMLIRDMLKSAQIPLMGADIAVLLPMRGVGELRHYLFHNDYRIKADIIVREHGRLYQLFSIERGRDKMPEGWPNGCFSVGFHAMGDPLFCELVRLLLTRIHQSLKSAKGSRAEAALFAQAQMLDAVLGLGQSITY